MKRTALKLSIPAPCTENWDNMTPNERGRHCASCDKTVIDFSLFTDKQLVEFFTKATDKICGRLNPMQLNRQLVYTEPKNYFLYKLLFGTAFTIGLAGSANGNYNYNNKPLLENSVPANSHNNNQEENKPVEISGDDSSFVKGKLADFDTKEPIPFAAVLLSYGNEQVATAYTDIDGAFKLFVPEQYRKNKLTLKIAYIGYNDFTKDITAKDFNVAITLRARPMVLGGAISIIYERPFDNDGWDKQTINMKDK